MDMDNLENSLNMEKNVENLESNIDSFKRYLKWRSEMQRFYYESLLERGFDEDQALVIASNFIDGRKS